MDWTRHSSRCPFPARSSPPPRRLGPSRGRFQVHSSRPRFTDAGSVAIKPSKTGGWPAGSCTCPAPLLAGCPRCCRYPGCPAGAAIAAAARAACPYRTGRCSSRAANGRRAENRGKMETLGPPACPPTRPSRLESGGCDSEGRPRAVAGGVRGPERQTD